MQKQKFQQKIFSFSKHNRRDFVWRTKKNAYKIDPYYVFVSEFMLQQTQVVRVIPKFELFIKKFPTIESLAQSPLRDILVLWQGLGYNRRAKFLHESAQKIVFEYKGIIPKKVEVLESLPGIGSYIARAIATFAYNQSEVFIETNIRTVFIHEFFKNKKDISDSEIFPYIEKTLDAKNPREWYYALMDYGSCLKKEGKDANIKSRHYVKQSKFIGSDRQIRGQILKHLVIEKSLPLVKLKKLIKSDPKRLMEQLKKLEIEKLIIRKGKKYSI